MNKILAAVLILLTIICLIVSKPVIVSYLASEIVKDEVLLDQLRDRLTNGYRSPYGPGSDEWQKYLDSKKK